MNKKIKSVAWLIIVTSSTLLSCDVPLDNKVKSDSFDYKMMVSRFAPLPRVATRKQSIKAANKIDSIVDEWQKKCAVPHCPTKLLKFSPAQSREESLGQRVLILESFFVPDSALLRYKNRVLGFYKISKDLQKYEEYFPDTEVYQPLDEISEYLSNLSYHVPAEALDFTKLQNSGFSEMVKPQPFSTHGEPIFEWLADLLPEAQFVIADIPTGFFSNEFFCHFYEGENLEAMSSIVAHGMLQLYQIIDTHKINYINISAAPSPESLERDYNMHCVTYGGKPFSAINRNAIDRFLELQAFIFQKLNEFPNISVFQSLPNTDHSIYRPENERDEVVAAPYENFVRIGYLATADYEFNEKGGFDSTLLAEKQLNQVFCASAYINGGFTEGTIKSRGEYVRGPEPIKISKNALYERPLGLGAKSPVRIMAASWATPLALAHAVYLKNTGGPQTPTELRNYWKTNAGQPKLLDPLKFNQFELYAGSRGNL